MEGRAVIHGVYDPNPLSVAGAQGMHAQFRPAAASWSSTTRSRRRCNDPAVDGLIICTPNFSHLDVVRVAAASGKHILLEKPMATTVCDAYAIMQIAQRHPAVFQIGLQYRYKPIYVEAIHEALERKTIGDIKTISILEHRFPFLDKVKQWNKFSKYSGGTLVEKCCHYFDLMNLFAGARPVSVYATRQRGGQLPRLRVRRREVGHPRQRLRDRHLRERRAGQLQPVHVRADVLRGDGAVRRRRAAEGLGERGLPAGRASRTRTWRSSAATASRRASAAPCYPAFIQASGHHGATYFEHVSFVDNIEGKADGSATAAEGLLVHRGRRCGRRSR